MYVSEVIKNDCRKWQCGDVVLISAPTGSGKTTAVLNCLREVACERNRSILYISNRNILTRQIKNILGREIFWEEGDEELYQITDFYGITVTSYQAIEKKLKERKKINLDSYLMVVYDEFQYILADSMFRKEIYYFVKWMQENHHLKSKIQIFISATPEDTWEFICRKIPSFHRCDCMERELIFATKYLKKYEMKEEKLFSAQVTKNFWKYKISQDIHNFNLSFYADEDLMLDYVKADASEEKWLIFISQKEKGKKYAKELKNIFGEHAVLFISTEEIEKNKNLIEEIVEKQKFSQKIVITTKILENGVSIHDDNLKNIVISTIWRDELLQMVGRKRCKEDEEVKLFLPQKSLNSFNGVLNRQLLPISYFLETAVGDVLNKGFDDEIFMNFAKKFLLYDKRKREFVINSVVVYVVKARIEFVKRMILGFQNQNDYVFLQEQCSWLKTEIEISLEKFVDFKIEKKRNIKFLKYCNQLVGKELGKEEQEELRKEFAKIKYGDNKRLLGLNKMNTWLAEHGDVQIVPNYSKKPTTWRILKNDES